MAEGGYDPETTNPFDTHGDDHDDDKTPLIKKEKEIGMKERRPPRRPPGYDTQHSSTSTSGEHETTFIDTPSGKVYVSAREQEMKEIERKVKEKLPNANLGQFRSRMDGFGQVFISLFRSGAKEHLLIDMNDELGNLKKIRNASKTLKDALGMTVEEIANENIAEETALKEKAEARVKELREQRENAFPEDHERIDAEIEREQEVANEAERNIEREETRLTLRERIKAIFKKHGFTAFAVATAIGTVIGVIVSNLKAGLTKVAKGVGNGLKELGKKLGEILPGMIGAIASFLFRTAGEVIGFLAKNAWLLIVGLVVLAVEQFKKKS